MEASKRRKISEALLCVLFYYCCSISLTLLNKYIFTGGNAEPDPNRSGNGEDIRFPFPLTMTLLHMTISFLLTLLVRQCRVAVPVLPREVYMKRLIPVGVATGLDIGLSNLSFLFLTVSFYQIVKSGVPLFVLAFAFALKLEEPTPPLIGAVVSIAGGIAVASAGEVNFNATGFVLLVSACLMAGIRVSMAQVLLQRSGVKLNPIAAMYYMSPVCAITLFPLAVIVEGSDLLQSGLFSMSSVAIRSWLAACGTAVIAFLLHISEFLLIGRTSALTMTITGISKEILVIFAAIITFHDELSFINILGFCVCIFGVGLYNFVKLRKLDAELGKTPYRLVELSSQAEALNDDEIQALWEEDILSGDSFSDGSEEGERMISEPL